ncbi:ABC-2 family transporter protein [Leptospira inadai serovar Lyme str. 10]|uniref:ABC-2 family transporter protein n=2 Tax=Leptospira inadai serovar Lyme TaxID=293084 RepID=V6H9V5_9LEPT|nr:ABC transporter permease [Leptospira inadai]EQA35018.1 ABC-2 family transporter protein [Leptospira inadai serovar Lyme str. 10]PNV75376.1 ABC transporter permease [Leptospira inadai serovar Lyme]
MKQIYHLVSIQLKEFYREPGIIFWAFVFPIAIAGVLGLAFTTHGVPVARVAIISSSPNAAILSQRIETAFAKTEDDLHGLGVINPILLSEDAAIKALKRGELNLLVKELSNGNLEYSFDPKNASAQRDYLLLSNALFAESKSKEVNSSIRTLDSKGTRYIDYLVPGMLAMGVMNSCLWGVGWNLIEMRMKKLLRRMSATPMNKLGFVLSFFFTRLIVTILESIIFLSFTFLVFDNAFIGSVPGAVLIYLTGNFTFACIGILVGSRAQNSQVGNGLVNAVTFPMMVLSGIFFSYKNFPDIVLPFVKNLPLTLMADSLRAVFIEGAGLIESLPACGLLFLFGAVFLTFGLRIFRWS